ncbi:FAD binding domain-containing protein [Biscogniauxia mediterranea]|nr:FAD binding domain-containing protein [Biscogniauxia mediterranea]
MFFSHAYAQVKYCLMTVIVVGAGLGGLGAAISILLAGHHVTVLESASNIGEIGAGIQVLSNSSRILYPWDLRNAVSKHANLSRYCVMMSWKGTQLSQIDFHRYSEILGAPFFGFHRADLNRCLLDRATELEADIQVSSTVVSIDYDEDGLTATLVLTDKRKLTADLIVGADGILCKLREILLEMPDPPVETGDLAYRLLIHAKDMLVDPELQEFIREPWVIYWIGPDVHAVCYVLRGGGRLNMVLIVPGDMPAGAMALESRFEGWDPRISKIPELCQSVHEWKLCIRPSLEQWCGMALEDGAALVLCLAKMTNKSPDQKLHAFKVYEEYWRERTEGVVERHQELGKNPFPWRHHGIGHWLLIYDVEKDVEDPNLPLLVAQPDNFQTFL